jgi:hypothetical protein
MTLQYGNGRINYNFTWLFHITFPSDHSYNQLPLRFIDRWIIGDNKYCLQWNSKEKKCHNTVRCGTIHCYKLKLISSRPGYEVMTRFVNRCDIENLLQKKFKTCEIIVH